jgi:hypothetical protein
LAAFVVVCFLDVATVVVLLPAVSSDLSADATRTTAIVTAVRNASGAA